MYVLFKKMNFNLQLASQLKRVTTYNNNENDDCTYHQILELVFIHGKS